MREETITARDKHFATSQEKNEVRHCEEEDECWSIIEVSKTTVDLINGGWTPWLIFLDSTEGVTRGKREICCS